MRIVEVTLPDGRIAEVQLPEAEVPQSFGEKVLKTLKGAGAQVLAGLASSAGPDAGVMLANAARGPEHFDRFIQRDLPAAQRALPNLAKENSTGSKGVDAFLQGAAGGLVGGAVPGSFLSAAAGGGVGGLVGEKVNEVFPQSPILGLIASVLAGGATSAGVARAQYPGLSAAEKRVGEAARTLTPADYAAAEKNLQLFAETNPKIATLVDAIPGKGSLLGSLGEETRAAAGGESFAQRVAQRADDLIGLGNDVKGRLPAALQNLDPDKVAHETTAAAQLALERAKKPITAALTARLQAIPPMTQGQAEGLYDALLKRAEQPIQDFDAEAFRKIAEALTSKNLPPRRIPQPPTTEVRTLSSGAKIRVEVPQPDKLLPGVKTRAEDISLALSEARDAVPKSITAEGNQTISPKAAGRAYRELVTAVEDSNLLPGFGTAKGRYRTDIQERWSPKQTGPLGDFAGQNPNIVDPKSAAAQQGRLMNSGPEGATKALWALGQENPELPGRIASALIEQKLRANPGNPGAALYGNQGSEQEARLMQVLKTGGLDAEHVLQPARAADQLSQRFTGPAGAMGDKPLHPLQFFIRSLRSLDFAFSSAATKKYYGEIANMLENPTPEALAKVRQLAQHDPTLGRIAAASGLFSPLAAASAIIDGGNK